MEKICWQITVAAFMQPLQYDLRSPAAKDNSITHAAVARSNLDAAITMRSAETELQNTIELRATGSEIAAPKPDVAAFMQPLQYDIYEVQLQKTIVLRMQPWQGATLTQPLLCDLQRLSCKTQ